MSTFIILIRIQKNANLPKFRMKNDLERIGSGRQRANRHTMDESYGLAWQSDGIT